MYENRQSVIVGKAASEIPKTAEYLMQQGKSSEAIVLFEKAILDENISKKAAVHANARLAEFYSKTNHQKAEEFIASGTDIDPDSPDISYAKARLFIEKGMHTEALETYTNLFNNWVNLRFNTIFGLTLDHLLCETADTFLLTEDAESALKLYTEALRINNNCAPACYGSARCFMTVDARQQAIEMLEWAIKLDPEFDEAKRELERLR